MCLGCRGRMQILMTRLAKAWSGCESCAMVTIALLMLKLLPGAQGQLGRVGEERCAFIRALVVVNQALMSRQHLEEQAEAWLREAGTTPPGNGIDRAEWEVR